MCIADSTTYYRIYDFTDWRFNIPENLERRQKVPADIDYKVGLTNGFLYRKDTFVKGELQKVIYYADEAHTIPVLEARFTYTREGGYAKSRVSERQWYLSTGELCPHIKQKVKIYSYIDASLEGKRRRGNIMEFFTLTVVGTIQATEQCTLLEASNKGRVLYQEYKDVMTDFVEASVKDIRTKLTNDTTHACLDYYVAPSETLRAYLLNELDI